MSNSKIRSTRISTTTRATYNPTKNNTRQSASGRHDPDRSKDRVSSGSDFDRLNYNELKMLKNETVLLPNKYPSNIIYTASGRHDPDRSKDRETRMLKNDTGYKNDYQKVVNECDKQKCDQQLCKMKVLMEINEKLILENNNFTKEIELLKNENCQDKLKYKTSQKMLSQIQEALEEKHAKYERTISQLRYENNELKTNHYVPSKEYKENFQKILNENDEQKKILRDLQKELDKMERKYDELEMNYDELKGENEKLRDKDNFLMTSNSSTDFKVSSGHDPDRLKYNGTFQEFDKLRTEMELLHNKYQTLKMTCKRYKNDYQKVVNECDKQKCDKQLCIDALETEKNNSIKKIEELEADLQKKQNAISSIRNKYKTLQSKNDELSGLTAFKTQSLSLKKQNEDFEHQVNNLTTLNEKVTTQLELITNENYQLKAEIKNMKLLKFGSRPTSSISANIPDPYIDENEKSQVKNEYSMQPFVNNEAESSIKDKNNTNVQKFPAWWSKHMCPETSSNQMETTKNESIKSKSKIKDTKLSMIPYKSISHNSDNYNKDFHNSIDVNEKSQVENKNSTQTFVDIVTEPSKKDKTFRKNRAHSNIYPAWWSNHIFNEK